MRARGLCLITAAVLAATVNTHAATPTVFATAVKVNGKGSLLLNSATKTFVYKPANGDAVNAIVRCLQVTSFKGVLPPPFPPVPTNDKTIAGRATAGGKTYYFTFVTVGSAEAKNVQAVFYAGVSRTATSPGYCGAGSISTDIATGVAIYG